MMVPSRCGAPLARAPAEPLPPADRERAIEYLVASASSRTRFEAWRRLGAARERLEFVDGGQERSKFRTRFAAIPLLRLCALTDSLSVSARVVNQLLSDDCDVQPPLLRSNRLSELLACPARRAR